MSAAHTPGLWVVKFRNDHSCLISFGDPIKGPHKQFDLPFDDRDPSDVADARLIAAAPELLEACESARDVLRALRQTMGGSYEQLERAISKATGEQA